MSSTVCWSGTAILAVTRSLPVRVYYSKVMRQYAGIVIDPITDDSFADGSSIRLYDVSNLKLSNLVGWDRISLVCCWFLGSNDDLLL